MYFIFNCIVFCRKTKRVPSHRIKYVVALHSSFTCYDIKCRIRTRMSYMKSLSGWIWKFNKGIIFGLAEIISCLKSFFVFPDFLPFFFNFFWIVTLTHFFTSFLIVTHLMPIPALMSVLVLPFVTALV